jgi:hypothetical protein
MQKLFREDILHICAAADLAAQVSLIEELLKGDDHCGP